MKSLYDSLGLAPPEVPEQPGVSIEDLVNLEGKAFAEAVVQSREFRQYIADGLKWKTLPPVILCRLLDHAWGKAPDRVEHTGKDGKPIETVTTVKRVVVRKAASSEEQDEAKEKPYVTH